MTSYMRPMEASMAWDHHNPLIYSQNPHHPYRWLRYEHTQIQFMSITPWWAPPRIIQAVKTTFLRVMPPMTQMRYAGNMRAGTALLILPLGGCLPDRVPFETNCWDILRFSGGKLTRTVKCSPMTPFCLPKGQDTHSVLSRRFWRLSHFHSDGRFLWLVALSLADRDQLPDHESHFLEKVRLTVSISR